MDRDGEPRIGVEADVLAARVCVGAALVLVAPVRLLLVAGLRVKQRTLLVLPDHSTDARLARINGSWRRPTVGV